MTESPVACNLTEKQFQQRRREVVEQLRLHIAEGRPLESGLALRFEPDAATLEDLMRAIQFERECCPFLRFDLSVEPQQAPIWLALSGPPGTKEFLEAELGLKP